MIETQPFLNRDSPSLGESWDSKIFLQVPVINALWTSQQKKMLAYSIAEFDRYSLEGILLYYIVRQFFLLSAPIVLMSCGWRSAR